MYIRYLFLFLNILVLSANAWAFNDSITHKELTEKAIGHSVIDKELNKALGIEGGVNGMVEGISLKEWIKYGSEQEDHPMCRASNHFHNPSLPWNESGLSDPFFPYIVYCSLFSSYSHNAMISDLTWATGYSDSPDTEYTDITDLNLEG